MGKYCLQTYKQRPKKQTHIQQQTKTQRILTLADKPIYSSMFNTGSDMLCMSFILSVCQIGSTKHINKQTEKQKQRKHLARGAAKGHKTRPVPEVYLFLLD